MGKNVHVVPIGKMIVSDVLDDVLVAYGLGSCVVICLYDSVARTGGMLHALLPTTVDENKASNDPTRFVDRGIPLLVDALVGLGARRRRLAVYLCGGAQMLIAPGFEDSLKIGERNVLAARVALQAAGLQVRAQDIGGHIGRTVRLYVATGRVTVRTLEQGERVLN